MPEVQHLNLVCRSFADFGSSSRPTSTVCPCMHTGRSHMFRHATESDRSAGSRSRGPNAQVQSSEAGPGSHKRHSSKLLPSHSIYRERPEPQNHNSTLCLCQSMHAQAGNSIGSHCAEFLQEDKGLADNFCTAC